MVDRSLKFQLILYDNSVEITGDNFELEHTGPLDVVQKSINVALDEAVLKAKDLFRGLT